MTNGIGVAVTEATRLEEIGFPEFTVKLVTDVFDALVAANMKQAEIYIELTKQVSKTLTEFVNSTKDDISGEMILQFLETVLNADPSKKVKVGEKLNDKEVNAIKNATMVPDVLPKGAELPELSQGQTLTLEITHYNSILNAVAQRIAADKYTMLKEMVKMGVLRIVVTHGIIETRLVFNTYTSTYYASNSSTYRTSGFTANASARTGRFLSKWIRASASASYSSIKVSTSNKMGIDISGSQVQIYGYVRIDFKTDYQQLLIPP